MGLVLYIVGLIAALIGSIIILIAAFRRGIGTGFLCLFIPFYILYFAFARYESERKGLVIALWLGGIVLAWIGIFAGALGGMF